MFDIITTHAAVWFNAHAYCTSRVWLGNPNPRVLDRPPTRRTALPSRTCVRWSLCFALPSSGRAGRRRDAGSWLNTRDFRRLWCAAVLRSLCSVPVFESVFVVAAVTCGHGFCPRVAAEGGARFHGPRPRRAGQFLLPDGSCCPGRGYSSRSLIHSFGKLGCVTRTG
jgi:hypothetical protein